MVSLGGVVGGALIVWVAPLALRGVFEMPLVIVTGAMALMFTYYRKHWYIDVAWAATSIAVAAVALTQIQTFSAAAPAAVRNFYVDPPLVDPPPSAAAPSPVMF